MVWLSLILAAVAGAAAALAIVQASSARHWRTRALTAEGLPDRAAARRSSASARGNVTRKSDDRDRFYETAMALDASMRGRISDEMKRARRAGPRLP